MSEKQKKAKALRGANISIYINHEKLLCLDTLAQETRRTRSIVIQHVLDSALEEMTLIERSDIIRVSLAIARIQKLWRSTLDEVHGLTDRKVIRKNARGVNISVWLSQESIEDIERLANELDVTRSRLIDMILEMRLSEVRAFTQRKNLSGDMVPVILKSMLRQSWRKAFAQSEQAMHDGEIRISIEESSL